MLNKKRLRQKFFFIRKKKYFDIKPTFFSPLNKMINKNYKNKNIKLSLYYPASFEVNVLRLFETDFVKKSQFFLPVLKENNAMHFYEWKINNLLKVNQYGLLEPVLLSAHIVPDIMLVPLLAYDKLKNRLGYGGGFYDRYLNKYLKNNNKILTIGIAFSFQKHHNLPVSKNDVKLNYILTEKGFI